MTSTRITLLEEDEQQNQPCGKSTLELMHTALKQKSFKFMDCVAY